MFFSLAIAYREYRIRLRNPIFPLWDVVVPLVYLLVFGASFEQLVGAATGVDYGTFLLGGVLSMVTFSIAWNSSYALFEDLQSGIFHEMLTYPFPRRDLLLGKLLFNASFSLFSSALCVVAGVIGLGIRIPAANLAGLALWIVLGTAAWFFVYSWMVLKVRGFNAYHTTTSGVFVLLMFVSNLFYPADRLPAWVQTIARANPVTWQTDLLRYYTIAEAASPSLAWEAAAFLAFTSLSFLLANAALNGPIE